MVNRTTYSSRELRALVAWTTNNVAGIGQYPWPRLTFLGRRRRPWYGGTFYPGSFEIEIALGAEKHFPLVTAARRGTGYLRLRYSTWQHACVALLAHELFHSRLHQANPYHIYAGVVEEREADCAARAALALYNKESREGPYE